MKRFGFFTYSHMATDHLYMFCCSFRYYLSSLCTAMVSSLHDIEHPPTCHQTWISMLLSPGRKIQCHLLPWIWTHQWAVSIRLWTDQYGLSPEPSSTTGNLEEISMKQGDVWGKSLPLVFPLKLKQWVWFDCFKQLSGNKGSLSMADVNLNRRKNSDIMSFRLLMISKK